MVKQVFLSLPTYLMRSARNYWITVGLTIASALVVAGAQDVLAQVYLRYLMGSFFLLVLPGYSLMNALFPGRIMRSTEPRIDQVYRAAFSIVLSIATVSVVAMILDYTPFGVSLSTLVSSLSLLTVFLATMAMLRSYQDQKTASSQAKSTRAPNEETGV